MVYGSLFTGIGGFDLGLDRAGHECAFQVERDANCHKVLGRHWPDVPRFDDVKGFNATSIPVRPGLICGGFPCQDLSVAGRRAGLAGERSGLFFEFMRIVAEFAPRWVLIENVPGLLSSNGGRDMGAVVGTLGQLGYGWAYRVLDAQWFGVPQRRRRVFIVGCFGNSRRAAEVLFERESLPWDSPPSREAGARVARSAAACLRGNQYCDNDGDESKLVVTATLNSGGSNGGFRTEPGEHLVAHALTAEGFDASEDGTGRGTPIIPIDMRQASRGDKFTNNRSEGSSGGPPGTGIGEPGDPSPTIASSHTPAIAFDTTQITSAENRCNPQLGDPCHPLAAGAHAPAVAFQTRIARNGRGQPETVVPSLNASQTGVHGDSQPHVAGSFGVRRLTPVECERLQGFPDHWTAGLSDSGRYRCLGNAVAMPCAEWIGRRFHAWTY